MGGCPGPPSGAPQYLDAQARPNVQKMGKRSPRPAVPPSDTPRGAAEFPLTRTEVLRSAAAGDWEPFLADYLQPCWQEVVIVCRQYHVPLADAEDLYQEFLVRILQDAGFGWQMRRLLAEAKEDPDLHGNLPFRYLVSRRLPLGSARFRTYLKGVIHKLLLETLRKSRRLPKPQDDRQLDECGARLDQSIGDWLDGQWAATCCLQALREFQQSCQSARTRGRRRLFEVLYLALIRNQSANQIAEKYGLDPSTARRLLSDARAELEAHLHTASRIHDCHELASFLQRHAAALHDALVAIYATTAGHCRGEG